MMMGNLQPSLHPHLPSSGWGAESHIERADNSRVFWAWEGMEEENCPGGSGRG
jgi:hypothetical protein